MRNASWATPVTTLLAALAFAGCSVEIKDTADKPGGDDDRDGFVGPSDCDEGNPNVHAGAPEHCDGVDENCNGQVDENPVEGQTIYTDLDGDGYGDRDSGRLVCEADVGEVTKGGDCNDRNADAHPGADESGECDSAVDLNCDGRVGSEDADRDGWQACDDCDDNRRDAHPSAVEYCDGYDNDCDGDTDEADAANAPLWYRDADDDTYGNAWQSRQACTQPEGFVDNLQDCNDTDPEINPDGTEVCNQVDDDCDGVADEEAVDGVPWYRDQDGDGYGYASATRTACSGADGEVSNNLDCLDSNAQVNPAADEMCNNRDDDCDGATDENPVDGTVYYVDVDGDGYAGTTPSDPMCHIEDGYGVYPADCDDGDVSINPAATDVAYDGIDQDCDESDLTCADVDATDIEVYEFSGTNDGFDNSYAPSCASRTGGDYSVRWTVPATGTWSFDTDGSDYDTVLALYAGDCSGSELACNDDEYLPGGIVSSYLTADLTEGDTIIIVLDGYSGATGEYYIAIRQVLD